MSISKKTAGLAVGKAIGLALDSPAFAQSSAIAPAAIKAPSDVIVAARSVDGRLQDVPNLITVFNQQQLRYKNVTEVTNLANYTTSLPVKYDFGEYNTTFAIGGFIQDIGIPPVGTFFGDI